MTYFSKKILQLAAIFFAIVTLILLGEIDSFIYRLTEAFFPGSGALVCFIFVVLEIIGLYALYRSFFSRPARLLLKANATEEERRAFAAELKARLRKNSYVRAANLSPDDPEFVSKAMQHLDAIADAEIRANGKRVFLGTALAQNGRLDALIVFFSLCRMVWRTSLIYNQRPTAEEFISVCNTVSQSTFVAFSIDALDIPQMITDTMNEMMPSIAPAVAAQSLPFVGSCLHVFTESLIDGAANCLLAVRAGIITRRAYRYAMYGGEESLRRSCVRETGQVMLDITQESVRYVANALRKEIQELSVDKGKQLVRQTAQGVRDTASYVGEGAGRAVNAVKDGASYLVDGATLIKDGVSSAAGQVTDFVVDSAKQAVDFVTPKQEAKPSLPKQAETQTAQGVRDTATYVGEGAGRAVNAVKDGASYLVDGATLIKDGVSSAAGQVTDFVVDSAKQAVDFVTPRQGAKSSLTKQAETLEQEKSQAEKPKEETVRDEILRDEIVQDKIVQDEKLQEGLVSQPHSTREPESKVSRITGQAEKAFAAVSEGTGLIVDGVTSVAGQAASAVQSAGSNARAFVGEQGKKIGGFFQDKKKRVTRFFSK